MAKTKSPKNLREIKERVLSALSPIRQVDESRIAQNDFLWWGKRTNAGRSLPEHYLVFFLFSNLLGFRNMGLGEKVAWSFPIDFNGKIFLIDYRKLGVGVFASNLKTDEDAAKEIVRKIHRSIKIAKPFFECLANNAVLESKLNVKNKCLELFGRYEYLLTLYRQALKKADKEKGKSRKKPKRLILEPLPAIPSLILNFIDRLNG